MHKRKRRRGRKGRLRIITAGSAGRPDESKMLAVDLSRAAWQGGSGTSGLDTSLDVTGYGSDFSLANDLDSGALH